MGKSPADRYHQVLSGRVEQSLMAIDLVEPFLNSELICEKVVIIKRLL